MDSLNQATSEMLKLWPNKMPVKSADDFMPIMELYRLPEGEAKSSVLVIPGGGYGARAAHEGVDIALKYNELGFNAFVVQYRVSPNRHPAPLLDAQRALRIIRKNAERWNLTDRVAVCGFSAGGHLAASTGVHHGLVMPDERDKADEFSGRPDAMILSYPVITSGDRAHQGSFVNLLGEGAPAEAMELMSLEKQVKEDTPPAFLWHTAEDGAVPVENSMLFASALHAKKIPFELHIYPFGRHGLGITDAEPHILTWIDLSAKWLRRMGF